MKQIIGAIVCLATAVEDYIEAQTIGRSELFACVRAETGRSSERGCTLILVLVESTPNMLGPTWQKIPGDPAHAGIRNVCLSFGENWLKS